MRNNKHNKTSGFSEVQKVCCVQGQYPEKLLYLWELYDETRGSENDSPEIFGEDQLYIVLQLANGGTDLEAFIFNNSLQAYTTFQQVSVIKDCEIFHVYVIPHLILSIVIYFRHFLLSLIFERS